MVIVKILQVIIYTGAGVIGLGVIGLVFNSVAHSRACKVHASTMATPVLAMAGSGTRPAFVPMDTFAEPPAPGAQDDHLWRLANEAADTLLQSVKWLDAGAEVTVAGRIVTLAEGSQGTVGEVADRDGNTVPVWFPKHLLRTPSEGQIVSIQAAVVQGKEDDQKKGLKAASWGELPTAA